MTLPALLSLLVVFAVSFEMTVAAMVLSAVALGLALYGM
jgi:hypothetical protein